MSGGGGRRWTGIEDELIRLVSGPPKLRFARLARTLLHGRTGAAAAKRAQRLDRADRAAGLVPRSPDKRPTSSDVVARLRAAHARGCGVLLGPADVRRLLKRL